MVGKYTSVKALLITCSAILLSDGLLPTAVASNTNNHKGPHLEHSDPHVGMNFHFVPTAYHGYDSTIDAVVAAGNQYNPGSIARDVEYMGAILQQKSGADFAYTVGEGLRGADTVTVRFRVPKGYRVVAFWHTHGAHGPSRELFSEIDTALADAWNVPFFLADPKGKLRVFTPGGSTLSASRVQRLGLGLGSGYARGQLVRGPLGDTLRIATSLQPLQRESQSDGSLQNARAGL